MPGTHPQARRTPMASITRGGLMKTRVFVCSLVFAIQFASADSGRSDSFLHFGRFNRFDQEVRVNTLRMLREGLQTFRHDTFGDEAFWGDTLQLHQALANLKPRDALAL